MKRDGTSSFDSELFSKFTEYEGTEGKPNGVLLHLCTNSFVELSVPFLQRVENEIVKKAWMVETGIDEFTECERLVFDLLNNGY